MTAYFTKLKMDILTNQLEEGQHFARSIKQCIMDAMIIYEKITLLNNTCKFRNDTKEWIRKNNNLKTWAKFKTHFFQSHEELKNQATTTANGGYNAVVNHVYNGNLHTPAPA